MGFEPIISSSCSITTSKNAIVTHQKKRNCQSIPIFTNWGSFSNRDKRFIWGYSAILWECHGSIIWIKWGLNGICMDVPSGNQTWEGTSANFSWALTLDNRTSWGIVHSHVG